MNEFDKSKEFEFDIVNRINAGWENGDWRQVREMLHDSLVHFD